MCAIDTRLINHPLQQEEQSMAFDFHMSTIQGNCLFRHKVTLEGSDTWCV